MYLRVEIPDGQRVGRPSGSAMLARSVTPGDRDGTLPPRILRPVLGPGPAAVQFRWRHASARSPSGEKGEDVSGSRTRSRAQPHPHTSFQPPWHDPGRYLRRLSETSFSRLRLGTPQRTLQPSSRRGNRTRKIGAPHAPYRHQPPESSRQTLPPGGIESIRSVGSAFHKSPHFLMDVAESSPGLLVLLHFPVFRPGGARGCIWGSIGRKLRSAFRGLLTGNLKPGDPSRAIGWPSFRCLSRRRRVRRRPLAAIPIP